ncbi:MAG: DUF3788 family protein [Terracidiphilus sp.]|jgi:hypothetical protein
MELQNAFINHAEQPTAEEVALALGAAAKLWDQLVNSLTKELGVTAKEWHRNSPKYGWALRLSVKKRRIIYLSPCSGCFRVALVLGDKAIAAAKNSGLPVFLMEMIEEAPRYPEGTAIRLVVKTRADLTGIRELAVVKLAN